MKKIYLVILSIIIILAILIISVILINNNNSNNEIELTSTQNSTVSKSTILINNNTSDNEIELPAPQSSTNSRNTDNIFMSIKDGSITPTGLTVIIDDKNEIKSKVLISRKYFIDKKIKDEWKEIYSYLDPTEIYVDYINYPSESKLDWTNELGELEQGTYRIRYYPILNQSKEVEFNIN